MGLKTTILGAGPGGYVAAVKAAQLGADVTIVEDDNVGGDLPELGLHSLQNFEIHC